MERKVQSEYLDESLGFPVMLQDVPMRKVRDEWVPDLPLNEYQQVVLWILAHKDGPLSGRQVRFVRHWMELTQVGFGELFGVSNACVSKWEDKGAEPTAMGRPTEMMLRLEILQRLPEDIWEKLSSPGASMTRRQSLRKMLEDLKASQSASDDHQIGEQVTLRGGEFARPGHLPLRA